MPDLLPLEIILKKQDYSRELAAYTLEKWNLARSEAEIKERERRLKRAEAQLRSIPAAIRSMPTNATPKVSNPSLAFGEPESPGQPLQFQTQREKERERRPMVVGGIRGNNTRVAMEGVASVASGSTSDDRSVLSVSMTGKAVSRIAVRQGRSTEQVTASP